ncbi:sugar phosphate isomerase/epimerase [Sphingobium sufflavum]|uniref:sugar phosphate isomerase/epimerase family protein n=1 Tax=Sphingobium sufflavum TaxID=1129547 RepID=UPI001F4627DE|nr:TIM barrel protein [Sphingobium sufflavum]MCE7795429.1 sugar phosphate isomerase/epimerase [Sphingobium sufflavum]
MNRIGLDFISVLGLPPLDYIALAARLGYTDIGIAPGPVVSVPDLFPAWTLRDNPGLIRDVRAAVADHGLHIAVGEGFFLLPGGDVAASAADLDLLAEVGAPRCTIVSFEGDRALAFDRLAQFAELATARGLGAQIEFVPGLGIGDLPTALAAVEHVGRPDFGLVIDAMHLFRSGASAADVAALDPAIIAHIQLCDVPVAVAAEGYGYEASFERLCPGAGELPLQSLVDALPRGRTIGLEIPMKTRTLAGDSFDDQFAPCLAATRAMLALSENGATAG